MINFMRPLLAAALVAAALPATAAQDPVNIGVTPNNGQGDPFRTAVQKLNRNDAELYAAIASIQAVLASLTAANPVTSVAGRRGAVTLSSTDLSDATSLGRSILNGTSPSGILSTLGGAPLAGASFTGPLAAPSMSLTGALAASTVTASTSATVPKITISGSGSSGDGSLFTALPSSASTPRSIAARALDMGRNVRDFGAVCDGATDNGPAFRAAVAVARVVRYDLEGCASHYLINTSVTIPAGVSVVGPADGLGVPLGIRTVANVDTFVAGGPQYGVINTRIQHDGSTGQAINGGSANNGTISRNAIIGSVAGNTAPLVYTSGSLITANDNTFTNQRTNAYAIVVDSPGSTAPIVLRFKDNNFGGAGKGILISNSGGVARPEGVYLTNNHCFLTNICMLITSVNDLRSVGNTYDIGSTNQVVLAASGQGIDLASFTDDYFSTLDTTTTPPSTRTAGVCLQVSGPVARLTVRSKFAYCGFGVTSTDGNASNFLIGSNFLNIANTALNLQGVKGATLTNNTCTSCANNFIISDGASGGPFVLNENQWDPAGAQTITQTTPANFRFGGGNTGANLAGYSAATTASMATGTTCVNLVIPHGLKGTPNLDKITLSPRIVSGTMTSVTAAVQSVDGTNISTQVCAAVSAAGTVRVTANASL
jgi:hypothetical protein